MKDVILSTHCLDTCLIQINENDYNYNGHNKYKLIVR